MYHVVSDPVNKKCGDWTFEAEGCYNSPLNTVMNTLEITVYCTYNIAYTDFSGSSFKELSFAQ